ncbi:MAG: hypothetical protein A2Y33_13935 [Spirochaetes bacterium GWF1_51_8]|nr:MAG: hypothetical protein A2Y33_13935 [Spirochaetes bacterium GWF1_51_8]
MAKTMISEEFMSPEEIEMLIRAARIASSPFSKILFFALSLIGTAAAIIGMIINDTRMIMIGILWMVIFIGLIFIVHWTGKDYKLDLAEHRKVIVNSIVEERIIEKVIKNNSASIVYRLRIKEINFEVSRETYERFDKGDTVTVHYTKHARVLLLLKSR